MKNKFYFDKQIVFTSIFGFSILFFAQSITQKMNKPEINISKQESAINLNQQVYQLFHAGQKRLLSSGLWIVTNLESDLEHYKKRDLNSWMYHRFKSIVTLDPLFEFIYPFGGVYLSIVKDDIPGASDIYSSGLKLFPDNYYLTYNAAYHFYFEAKDYVRAEPLYQKLLNDKRTPSYMRSPLARIYSSQGKLEDAFQIILENYRQAPEGSLQKNKMHEQLYAIKAEMDLKCLNEKLSENCSLVDFDGEKYLYREGKYSAQKNWALYKIN